MTRATGSDMMSAPGLSQGVWGMYKEPSPCKMLYGLGSNGVLRSKIEVDSQAASAPSSRE